MMFMNIKGCSTRGRGGGRASDLRGIDLAEKGLSGGDVGEGLETPEVALEVTGLAFVHIRGRLGSRQSVGHRELLRTCYLPAKEHAATQRGSRAEKRAIGKMKSS